MRILHITPYAYNFYGGPNTAVRMMAKLSLESGCSVDVVTSSAAGKKDLEHEDGIAIVEDGISFRYFKRTIFRNWFFSLSMLSWLKSNIKNYDVVHLHVPFTAPFMIGAKIANNANVPFLVSLHGLLDPWCLKQKSWKKIPYFYIFEKLNLKRASLLHVTSNLEAEYVRSLNLNVPLEVFPLPIDGEVESGDKNRMTDLNLIKLLFLGRLHPVKSLPVVFDAIRILRDDGINIQFNVAGSGENSYELALKHMAKDRGIEDRIIWHGHANTEAKRELFLASDIFIMPSYHENFGLAAAEAMSSGLPVIVSNQVGLAEDVSDFNAGIVVACDSPHEIASAIKRISSPKLNALCSYGATELVRLRYSPNTCAKNLISIYTKALQSAIINLN